jgi:hypothetical protein
LIGYISNNQHLIALFLKFAVRGAAFDGRVRAMIVEVHWHAWICVRGCERTKKLEHRQISAFHPATTGQAPKTSEASHNKSQDQPAQKASSSPPGQ